ncbi:MAG: Type secretion system protein virB8 [Pseudomonadota bacterium]|jgi:type IV secretion system protein VirB8
MNRTSMTGALPVEEPARPAGRRSRNADWEVDRQQRLERSERRAWQVALGSVAVALLALATVAAQGALREVVPLPVVVDRSTGEVTIQQRLASETLPVSEAVDKHHVARFVHARQAYVWQFLQRDYDTVARMSTPEVFEPYGHQFDGRDGLDQKWKASQEHRIHIVSVRLAAGQGAPGSQGGEAVVTYDEEILYADHAQPDVTTRHVATVRFEYRPKVFVKEADRLDNPLGFVVTAYRSDPEINRPGQPAAASPNAAGHTAGEPS